MFVVGIGFVAVVMVMVILIARRGLDRSTGRRSQPRIPRWLVGSVAAAAVLLAGPDTARAVIVPTVELATAANYSVLAGTPHITNTGPSVLALDAGVSPGTAVVGFPPGQVLGDIDAGNAEALQGQADLTAAYVDAAGRPVDVTTTSDLGGLTLVGGVYSGPSKSPLEITGPLVLDGEGDPDAVFIFQTDSTLITDSASSVTLINGAQECNVFWQVGSSATLGTDSVFAGNILALTSISVTTGVTVHGRALARNGAVTLDTDVFETPTCDVTSAATTTAAETTVAAVDTTTAVSDTTTAASDTTTAVVTTLPGPVTTLPQTGLATGALPFAAAVLLAVGLGAAFAARRRQTPDW